jgi:dienelactone hydrolase
LRRRPVGRFLFVMKFPRRLLPALALAGCAAPDPQATATAGPVGEEGWELREQAWRIPGPGGAALQATLFRPPGPGPHPLVLLNHGQPGNPPDRRRMERQRFPQVSRLFVGEGFAVLLPMRRGFGASGGEFAGATGGCARMDLLANADAAADDIAAVLRWLPAGMPFLDPGRVVLAGQSAGGFGALAAAGRGLPGVAGVVNFAGGLRAGEGAGNGAGYCPGWQEALRRAMAALGRRAAPLHLPTLWIYAANDSYFGYGLAERLAEAWRDGGGEAEFHEIAATGQDGHGFIRQDGALSLWRGPVRRFLARLRAAGTV